MVTTAANVYLKYAYEGDTFGVLPSGVSCNKKFGLNDRFTSMTLTNNKINIPALGQNTYAKFAFGQQSGAANVGFILSNPWVFGAILGEPVKTGASAPFTYTYTPTTTVRRVQIESGMDGSSDVVRTFKGCVASTLGISTSVGGSVDCTLDFNYGLETSPSTTIGTAPTKPDLEFPFTFAHAELKFNNGVVAQCQDASLNLAQNAELLYGLNSHHAVSSFKKILDITGSFSATWIDKTLLEKVLEQVKAGTSAGTFSETLGSGTEMSFTFTKSASEKIVITCSGVAISDYAINGFEAVNPIFNEVSWQAKSISVAATNGQAAEE